MVPAHPTDWLLVALVDSDTMWAAKVSRTVAILGVPCMSGDDKRLTSLARGYSAVLQHSARVRSTFPDTFGLFFKQRLRWARNTWRSDMRGVMLERWAWRRPFLAFTMVDKMISSFTLLASPVFMTLALLRQDWVFVTALAIWWWLSRAMKLLARLRRRPSSFFFVPPFVLLSFAAAAGSGPATSGSRLPAEPCPPLTAATPAAPSTRWWTCRQAWTPHIQVHDNVIRPRAECVDVKEYSFRNVVAHNDCAGGSDPDGSWVSVRGNDNTVRDNMIRNFAEKGVRLGGGSPGQGLGNRVYGNTVIGTGDCAIGVMRGRQGKICRKTLQDNDSGDINVDGTLPDGPCP